MAHGDKYDYSNVVYKNSQIKVCIICPKHGAFYQTPNGHLTGNGCPKCRDEYTSLRCTLSTDEFIAKAMNAHGDKYDYSQVRYEGKIYPAISNVGYKPTVSQEPVLGVETYLYDFDKEIYGEDISVSLLSFKRAEMRFASVEELKARMQQDINDGKEYHFTK